MSKKEKDTSDESLKDNSSKAKQEITEVPQEVKLPETPKESKAPNKKKAEINLENQNLSLKNGQKLALQAGMSLTANIKLRKVSYLQLLFSNFKDKTKSLQELQLNKEVETATK